MQNRKQKNHCQQPVNKNNFSSLFKNFFHCLKEQNELSKYAHQFGDQLSNKILNMQTKHQNNNAKIINNQEPKSNPYKI